MSADERVKTTKKNLEGQVQEIIGKVTGDSQQKAKGKAKQEKAKAQQAIEDTKEQINQTLE